jgi:L-asparaginase / beta-aspartyl-peptidase
MLDKNTVGAVALDRRGNLACGVSTGGTGNNPPGRVGDSACVGGGFYADNSAGAAVMTGDGENILRLALAKSVVERLRDGCSPECVAGECIEQLERRVQGEVGCLVMNSEGQFAWNHNSPNMACAYMTSEMDEPLVYLHINEERKEASAGNA